MYSKKIWVFTVLTLIIFPASAFAGFVTESDAINVANSWLTMNESPMEESMGKIIREIQHYNGEKYGEPGYYVAFLEPNGWVVIPADDQFEPVLAFGKDFITPQAFEESILSSFFRIQSPVSSAPELSIAFSDTSKISKTRQQVNRRWQRLRINNSEQDKYAMSASSVITESLLNDLVVKPLLGERGSWLQWQPDVLAAYDQDGKPISPSIAPHYNFYNNKRRFIGQNTSTLGR